MKFLHLLVTFDSQIKALLLELAFSLQGDDYIALHSEVH